jgi:DNA repair exonuclease SbcCD nuclease subunit
MGTRKTWKGRMRILHLADVHLDRPLGGLSQEGGKKRRSEIYETFASCLEEAKRLKADVVTIAGDLWEDENVSPNTQRSVAYKMERLGIPVLISCGNHDPLLVGGNYERTSWPDNVHIFGSDGLEEYRLSEDVSLWGISWGSGTLSPAFFDGLSAARDGRAHILILHGTAGDNEHFVQEGDHCPFLASRVHECGFEICLAGHIHGSRTHEFSGRTAVVYPGSPEPLGWSETGDHCYGLIDVTEGSVQTELIAINTRRYEERDVDCAGCGSSAEVDRVLSEDLGDEEADRIFLRVRLVGEIEPDCSVDRRALVEKHGVRYAGLEIKNETRAGYDLETIASQPTAKGGFVRKLQERIADAADDRERETLKLALEAGLRSLDGSEEMLDVD